MLTVINSAKTGFKDSLLVGVSLLLFSGVASAAPITMDVSEVVDQIKAAAVPILSVGVAALTVLAIVAMVRWARGAM
ncbi:hypothetical protein BegalDRAFT_0947 [Beggiatoa alba B18LD]|uniref:Uncharacterized protein n=1 Tax=Beggiatoa alba B18LD TaxID=395493 RepID=I3CE11_9GAMM|nr:major capsid protein [Beggiatoa alba]EIJ41854.1 hypothetical protein BegalDRAFT_0947 [Beggiatoa alba B18LD]